MRKKQMWARFSLVALVGALAALLLAPGSAQANTWTDFGDSQWQSVYGVTAAQVDTVADGFQDGTFRPYAMVTRGQFAKMAVLGLGVATASPATPTFSDVPRSQTFFIYVEGAAAVQLVQGLGGTTFGPERQITRQQAATILARYLSSVELTTLGYIAGSTGIKYSSLSSWYAAEGGTELNAYSDQAGIASVHRPGMAYLVARDVTEGANGRLNPASSITRAQSAVMVLRAASAAQKFGSSVTAAPAITGVSPSTGSAVGGNTVVISGSNFTSDAVVMFGTTTVSSSNVTVNSSTQITATSPAGTAGTAVRVRVITSAGTSADTSADDFTYESTAAPTVTSVSPNTGDPDGGATITITGTSFNSSAQVVFGSTYVDNAKVTVVSSTQITVIAPAGTDGTTVQVKVITGNGTSADTSADDFTFKETSAPTITKLSRAAGNPNGGDTVVITGTSFTDNASVYFGGVEVADSNVSVNSAKQITVTSPAGTNGETVRVKVATDAGTSGSTLADAFSYGAPTVTSISPSYGLAAGGTTVVITGTGFSGTMTAAFGDTVVAAGKVTVTSAAQMTVVSPIGADGHTVDVVVTNDYASSAVSTADEFTYGNPTITSLTPAAGKPSGGDSVVITGSDFTDVQSVYFGSTQLDSGAYSVDSSTQITVVTPAGTSGSTVRVKVITAAGTTADTLGDDFSYGIPTVASLSRNHGDGGGGDSLYVRGTGYSGDVIVAFGGVALPDSDVTVVSPTSISVVSPAGVVGNTVDVTVSNDYGTSDVTSADEFTFEEEGSPKITLISPDTGSPGGGETVLIYGTNFTSDASVSFDGTKVPGAEVTVVGTTQISVVTPAGVGGHTAGVTVTTPVGTSSTYSFTYNDEEGTPTITKLSSTTGSSAGGESLVITGTSFTEDAIVEFGGTAVDDSDVTVNSSTKITVLTPEGTDNDTVEVTVTTPAGTSNAVDYTYEGDLPTITSLSIYAGASTGGYGVTIRGANFTNDATVEIDGVEMDETKVTFSSSTRIIITMPAGTGGDTVEITVTTSAGTSNAIDFTYNAGSSSLSSAWLDDAFSLFKFI